MTGITREKNHRLWPSPTVCNLFPRSYWEMKTLRRAPLPMPRHFYHSKSGWIIVGRKSNQWLQLCLISRREGGKIHRKLRKPSHHHNHFNPLMSPHILSSCAVYSSQHPELRRLFSPFYRSENWSYLSQVAQLRAGEPVFKPMSTWPQAKEMGW